jgi:hypothetical protein
MIIKRAVPRILRQSIVGRGKNEGKENKMVIKQDFKDIKFFNISQFVCTNFLTVHLYNLVYREA